MPKDRFAWTYRDGLARILRRLSFWVEPTRFTIVDEGEIWISGGAGWVRVYPRKPTPWWHLLTS